eukprot:TRINITY_DN135031_c3_g1_i1.p3 TRINITY_DN135031_c3_g1~~TRINITY_DN135031_c3_g1_i1.p3  ORF type:complete len:407 (-),score=93.01 TRINITY_DN135031_c3_g1_i1:2355-3575(-)
MSSKESTFSQDEPVPNPYKEPPLEKIFTYKDEQKELKAAEREKSKAMKVWEKGKPKNEGLIRKINGIKGSSENEEESKKQSAREAAEGLLPGERRKRTEGKNKLIEKKRDMFLLQMMLDLKKKEIQKMDDFKKLREQGLEYSEKMMEDDLQGVKRVVNDMKETCNRKINNAEAKAKENQRKELELKKIKEEISSLHNKINRDTDSLENGYKYMEFFLRLQSKDSNADHSSPAKKESGEANMEKKKKGGTVLSASLPEDMIAALSLRTELIDLINDSKNNYPMQFKEPTELYEVFLNLEEQNTTLIKRMQVQDEEIEQKKERFNKIKSIKETEINRLLQSKEQLEKSIKEQREHIQIITGPETSDTKKTEEGWLQNIANIVCLGKQIVKLVEFLQDFPAYQVGYGGC